MSPLPHTYDPDCACCMGPAMSAPTAQQVLDGLRDTREQDQRTRFAQQLKDAVAWTLFVGAPVSVVALGVAVGVVGK